MKFNETNLQNIKARFESETGVQLKSRKRPVGKVIRMAVILAAVIAMLTISGGATRLFGAYDDLQLSADYQGDGVVEISIDNLSDVPLQLEPYFFLKQWSTARVVLPTGDVPRLELGTIKAGQSVTFPIDLSDCYDVAALEEPLTDDWYYFVFTNDHFSFGHGWMCTINFGEVTITDAESDTVLPADTVVLEDVDAALRSYFEDISYDLNERSQLDRAYIQAYKQRIREFDGMLIHPVMPELLVDRPQTGVSFDDTVAASEQYTLVGEYFHTLDAYDKIIAMQDEYALVLSAYLPLATPEDTTMDVPLFYILSYPADQVQDDSYAFIRGHLLTFRDLEPYKVYADDRYVCYEVSHLFYSDLKSHTEKLISIQSDGQLTDVLWQRVENIYKYYRDNMSSLFYPSET